MLCTYVRVDWETKTVIFQVLAELWDQTNKRQRTLSINFQDVLFIPPHAASNKTRCEYIGGNDHC